MNSMFIASIVYVQTAYINSFPDLHLLFYSCAFKLLQNKYFSQKPACHAGTGCMRHPRKRGQPSKTIALSNSEAQGITQIDTSDGNSGTHFEGQTWLWLAFI